MKKLILISIFALISVFSYSQAVYKGITVNEPTHYQDNVYNSVYLKVLDVKIESLNSLSATCIISIYKTKAISVSNPEWTLKTNEIGNIAISFEYGDVINEFTIAGGIKQALLRQNETWNEANIIIE